MTKAEEMRNYAKEKNAENSYQLVLKEVKEAAKSGAYYCVIKYTLDIAVREKLELEGFVVTDTLETAGNSSCLISWY